MKDHEPPEKDLPAQDPDAAEVLRRANSDSAGDTSEPAAAGREAAGDSRSEPPAVAEQVVGVLFADGKVNEFDPAGHQFKVGDVVLVDNARDLNLGRVVYLGRNRSGQQLRRVKRRIGPQDWMLIRRNQNREEEAHELCLKLIAELGLPMKLIRVAYLHGGNKAIFYFSADGRVDFRELVRRLARALHVRIEMRQIGVRDESKMLGGVGICGQMLCCCRFLNKFVPVSIKMAKNQNLSLNPQKLSGLCGRLMCCLVYEDEVYCVHRKQLPALGKSIDTPQGPGKVIDLDVPRRLVKVELPEGATVFTLDELAGKPKADSRRPQRRDKQPAAEQAPGPAPEQAANEPARGRQQPAAGSEGGGRDNRSDKRKKRRSRSRARRRRKKSRGGADSGGGAGTGKPGS